MTACFACIHLMQPGQTADGSRLCRAYGLPVAPALEADCSRFVREAGSDDAIPVWYADAWHVGGEGRGD